MNLREFFTSNGPGSMGYAVPGALAARIAHPDRPVVAFTGDGGFLMTVAELQTAQRENLRIIVLVFDDQEIGLIRVKQEIPSSRRSRESRLRRAVQRAARAVARVG